MSISEPFYNLFDEPWISVEGLDGKVQELGIYDVIKNAHNLRYLIEPMPIVQISIYRLLICIIKDMHEIENKYDLEELLEKGQFDQKLIDEFKDTYYDRFFLFADTNAFYQGNFIDQKKKDSVSRLMVYLPTGNNETFFYHSFQNQHAISPKYCVKALLTWPLFATQGGSGYSPGINQKPPWYILIRGDNLFQTLVLNIPAVSIEINSGPNITPWNSDDYVGIRRNVSSVSTIYGMTFLPRYIHLIPDGPGYCTFSSEWSDHLVKEIIFQMGNKFTGKWIDPNVGYKIDAKRGPIPLRPVEGERVWQNISGLIFLKENEEILSQSGKKSVIKYKRATIIDQYIDFQVFSDMVKSDREILIEIYGLRSDQAKINEWHRESFTLPAKIMLIEDIGRYIFKLINLAYNFATVIRKSIELIFKGDTSGNSRKKSKSSPHSISINASREYLSTMESIFKHEFIAKLGKLDPNNQNLRALMDTIEQDWKDRASAEARSIIEYYLDLFDTNSKLLERKSRAERYFYGARKQILGQVQSSS